MLKEVGVRVIKLNKEKFEFEALEIIEDEDKEIINKAEEVSELEIINKKEKTEKTVKKEFEITLDKNKTTETENILPPTIQRPLTEL